MIQKSIRKRLLQEAIQTRELLQGQSVNHYLPVRFQEQDLTAHAEKENEEIHWLYFFSQA